MTKGETTSGSRAHRARTGRGFMVVTMLGMGSGAWAQDASTPPPSRPPSAYSAPDGRCAYQATLTVKHAQRALGVRVQPLTMLLPPSGELAWGFSRPAPDDTGSRLDMTLTPEAGAPLSYHLALVQDPWPGQLDTPALQNAEYSYQYVSIEGTGEGSVTSSPEHTLPSRLSFRTNTTSRAKVKLGDDEQEPVTTRTLDVSMTTTACGGGG